MDAESVLSIRCCDDPTATYRKESSSYLLTICVRSDDYLSYQIRRSYEDFLDFDSRIRGMYVVEDLTVIPVINCRNEGGFDGENSPHVMNIAENFYSMIQSYYPPTSSPIRSPNLRPNSNAINKNITPNVDILDFYLQDILSRHEIIASKEFLNFLDPKTDPVIENSISAQIINENMKHRKRDVIGIEKDERDITVHELILINEQFKGSIVKNENEIFSINILIGQIIVWKYFTVGYQSTFALTVNGVKKMCCLCSDSIKENQCGAFKVEQSGVCNLIWTPTPAYKSYSIIPRQLFKSVKIISQEEYNEKEMLMKNIVERTRIFDMQRHFLKQSSLHRAQCLSGIQYFGSNNLKQETAVSDLLILREKEIEIKTLHNKIKLTEVLLIEKDLEIKTHREERIEIEIINKTAPGKIHSGITENTPTPTQRLRPTHTLTPTHTSTHMHTLRPSLTPTSLSTPTSSNPNSIISPSMIPRTFTNTNTRNSTHWPPLSLPHLIPLSLPHSLPMSIPLSHSYSPTPTPSPLPPHSPSPLPSHSSQHSHSYASSPSPSPSPPNSPSPLTSSQPHSLRPISASNVTRLPTTTSTSTSTSTSISTSISISNPNTNVRTEKNTINTDKNTIPTEQSKSTDSTKPAELTRKTRKNRRLLSVKSPVSLLFPRSSLDAANPKERKRTKLIRPVEGEELVKGVEEEVEDEEEEVVEGEVENEEVNNGVGKEIIEEDEGEGERKVGKEEEKGKGEGVVEQDKGIEVNKNDQSDKVTEGERESECVRVEVHDKDMINMNKMDKVNSPKYSHSILYDYDKLKTATYEKANEESKNKIDNIFNKISDLFDDIEKGKKKLFLRASKREEEVTKSIIENISRIESESLMKIAEDMRNLSSSSCDSNINNEFRLNSFPQPREKYPTEHSTTYSKNHSHNYSHDYSQEYFHGFTQQQRLQKKRHQQLQQQQHEQILSGQYQEQQEEHYDFRHYPSLHRSPLPQHHHNSNKYDYNNYSNCKTYNDIYNGNYNQSSHHYQNNQNIHNDQNNLNNDNNHSNNQKYWTPFNFAFDYNYNSNLDLNSTNTTQHIPLPLSAPLTLPLHEPLSLLSSHTPGFTPEPLPVLSSHALPVISPDNMIEWNVDCKETRSSTSTYLVDNIPPESKEYSFDSESEKSLLECSLDSFCESDTVLGHL